MNFTSKLINSYLRIKTKDIANDFGGAQEKDHEYIPCILVAANPKQNLHNQMKSVQDGYKASHN